jgi:filamentous hemagglutinin
VWDESADEFVTAFTSTGETNTTITITSYANFHTQNANIGGNLIVGGNISITGNVASLNVTGNITGGNLLTPGVLSAAGNATGGNVLTGGLVSATANVTGGNLLTGGLISATSTITSAANITGGNLLTGGLISATATITGGNLATGGTVSATANITGGNVLTGGLISATSTITSAANITGGNVLTGGLISATSTITSAANITGGNLLTGGLISATSTITSAANITGGNLLTGGLITSTGNITGGNILTGGLISAAGNIIANPSSFFIGNGSQLTGVAAASANFPVSNGTSNINAAVNANITVGVAGTSNVAVFATTGVFVTGDNSVSGNVTGGNVLTGGIVSATANVTGGNVTTGGLVTATGNVTGGNLLTGGRVSATGDIFTAGNLSLSGNIVDSGALTITTGSGNLNLEPTGNIVLGNRYVNGVALPVQDQDAASKIYVDNLVTTAISYHEAVVAATTGNLNAATGGTVTYNQPNGASNGVGATLTTTGSFTTIDTANVQTVGTRILVKDQANAVQNGVYVYSNATVITRASTEDTYGPASANTFSINDYFFVTSGNVNAGSAWIVDSPAGTITFGTSNILFAQFSQSQVYSANTSAGLSLIGTVFSAKVDNNTTAFDLNGNISVKAGANLTTPNIGAATGTSLSVTGAVNAGTTMSAAGNITGGNLLTGGLISATSTITSAANITGGNLLTGGLISATSTITSAANITGGNLLTGGLVTATGNVTGGNITTGGLVTATGNVTGGNLLTGGLISATSTITSAANITGGNLLTGGLISATSNITGGNLLFGSGIVSGTGNIYANNIFANISGNIDAGGANTNIQFNDNDLLAGSPGFTFDKTSNAVVANGNITGSNFTTAGVVTATGNITGGNLLTGGLISATSTITSAANITGGNLLTGGLISATSTITSAANITGGNVLTGGLISATSTITSAANITGGNVLTGGLITATGNITGANLILTTGIIDGPAAGRITINGSDIDTDFAVDGDTLANVFYVDAGTGTASFGSSTQVTNAIVNFAVTTSIKTPVGNTAQRPATGVTGMLRFNTTTNALEIYNNTEWESVGVPAFTVIADQQFNGDGSTVTFTLGSSQTTNSCIVSINGVVQIPTLAYSVSTTTLTFTEAPLSGDVIDVRQITTTTTVTAISNTSGNAVIEISDTSATVAVTGNLIPSTDNVSTLGNATNRWANLFVSGNSIYLGNLILKENPANVFVVYLADGVTQANIDVGNVDVSAITSGTSTIGIYGTGQTYMSVNGNANVLLASNTSVLVNGAFSATSNITGGNILTGGLISATGAITGAALTGTSLTVSTGNITGGNLLISGAIEDSGQLDIRTTASNANIVFTPNGTGNINTSANIMPTANATSNIGSATLSYNTIFAKATSAQYADLAEKYTADADYAPGTVVMFGGSAEITICSNDACQRVAGVISTNPSYIMNGGLESDYVATVALTGRVPCKVTGTVRKGDLMISAGNGTARAEADPKVGTVIGKALADSNGDAVIEVVVGRF